MLWLMRRALPPASGGATLGRYELGVLMSDNFHPPGGAGAGNRVSRTLLLSSVATSIALTFLLSAGVAQAEEVAISPDVATIAFEAMGQSFAITRDQDLEATIKGEFARTSRACPPNCIQPMRALRNVETVGELEVLKFLQDKVAAGSGVLLDVRVPEWFAKGAIPGAVNVPFATMEADNPFRNDILAALGATPTGGETFDFSQAVSLVVYCNGPWSDQSLRVVRALREAGYPADKLNYYRGGMQDWLMLGLSTTAPVLIAEGQP
jgi:rhodanese-related sulfurtransferase